MQTIVVVDYDPIWPEIFQQLQAHVWPVLADVAVRDYLRSHPETAQAYAELKKQLASEFPHDIDSYVEGKTGLILGILREHGLSAEQLQAIEQANRKK